MRNYQKPVSVILAVFLCLMVVFSVADTVEKQYDTNFDQDLMRTHIENLTANGPRSIADKEANQLALDYIVQTLESWGIVEGDRSDVPAYMIQDFVSDDIDYQNFYLKNIIVHIPANGDAPTGDAVMFMGHTDSVTMGAGASDDGVAVATMLEAIRTYTDRMADGFTMNNDLVFCFVNGEEYGLYGSEAFIEEFTGFDSVVDRIRFGVNLESRGTEGTLIMFETAANNYNTIKLLSQVNENVFTCSIATMIYDMMPNGTDFSNFKQAYQGLNFANISGGENYHTQNDDCDHLGSTYLSQNAMIVDALIEKLADYDLDQLYDAEESAIFFSYLNVTTVVYNHTAAYVMAAVLILMVAANIWLNRKNHNLRSTVKGIVSILLGLVLTAGVTWVLYYLFQYIAVLTGTLDIHMVGTITFSNTAIVVGIGLVALAVTIVSTRLFTKWLRITPRDMTRAFAYIHAALGIVLTFVLADASYLFVFSGLMFMINELVISKKPEAAGFHGELLATALYMPIIMPVLVLATSALGLTMAYVFGLIFALGIYAVGIDMASWDKRTAPAIGAAACVIFLCVSLCKPNANVNLQGKQNHSKLPWDDALVYVIDEEGETGYRIYDLNAVSYLEPYAPELTWQGEYYEAEGSVDVEYSLLTTCEGNTLHVRKYHESNLVYLTFTDIQAESFTIDDGLTVKTYEFGDAETYGIILHSDATVTVNGGTVTLGYREVLRDYDKMIPADYAADTQRLHFNLWLLEQFELGS